MAVNIVIDHASHIGGDCTQHYVCHLDTQPTLQEFVDHVLANKREWGNLEIDRLVIEYRHGEIVDIYGNYDAVKDKRVSLVCMSGGWSRMDYTLVIDE